MVNSLDRMIAFFDPERAVRRALARRAFAYYESATADRARKGRRESGGPDRAVLAGGRTLREQARYLEQNHDLARGVLSVLVTNTVGPNGITVEPQPRTKDGEIHDGFAREIMKVYRDWSRLPETTWHHDFASAQRIAARTWFRDGEMFAQFVEGTSPTIEHGSTVPFSLELLEPDYVPFDFNDTGKRIVQGVERNAWGRAVAFHFYKEHPGESMTFTTAMKRVPASRILHVKLIDRIRQARGVSVFAAVMTRLDDIKDYEESERIAAKVAASMAAYIRKGNPEMYAPDDADGKEVPRYMKFRPGMVFDDLRPGEEIGTIDTSRPNPGLEGFRKGQLRATASGVGTTYSSLAKDYNGTYSSQRQELVEAYGAYQILSAEFTSQFVQPVYERFVAMAVLSGRLKIPKEIDPDSIDDCLYIAPQMPWIDPEREANAWGVLEDKVYASGPEIIRRRGQNPYDVLEQEARWQREKEKRKLVTETNTTKNVNNNAAQDNAANSDATDNANGGNDDNTQH